MLDITSTLFIILASPDPAFRFGEVAGISLLTVLAQPFVFPRIALLIP
jgi:hypothetical protein